MEFHEGDERLRMTSVVAINNGFFIDIELVSVQCTFVIGNPFPGFIFRMESSWNRD